VELLTLKQIANRLNLPPATVKYYRDQFSDYMPAVNVGRYPRYGVEVLEIMQDIRRLFGEGFTREQVADHLKQNYAINQTAELTTTATATTIQQPEFLLDLMEKNADLLQEQHSTIANQAALIEKLTEQLNREQRVKEQLLLQEIKRKDKQAEPEEEKRPWWKRGKH